MSRLSVLLFTCVFALFCTSLSAEEDTPKWIDTSGDAPSDAVVIFDGEGTDQLVDPQGGPCPWKVEDGELVVGGGEAAWTKFHFRDAQVHCEFLVPETDRRGEDDGNSGLYFHGMFEQQIVNSYKNPTRPKTIIGALYRFSPPLVNAAKPPGQWQTYDIIYKAPRRDENGEAIEEGTITALLNGVLVQHDTKFLKRKSPYAPLWYRKTDYTDAILASIQETEAGPLQLQNHGNPVRYRKLWIRPLDDKAFMFEPGASKEDAAATENEK